MEFADAEGEHEPADAEAAEADLADLAAAEEQLPDPGADAMLQSWPMTVPPMLMVIAK